MLFHLIDDWWDSEHHQVSWPSNADRPAKVVLAAKVGRAPLLDGAEKAFDRTWPPAGI